MQVRIHLWAKNGWRIKKSLGRGYRVSSRALGDFMHRLMSVRNVAATIVLILIVGCGGGTEVVAETAG